MELEEILGHIDHTLLAQDATWQQIREVCDDAVKYNTASVCIPPSYVKQVREYLNEQESDVAVCTVIGFPHGYSTTETKVFETKDAILKGANEIDMVINIGWVKDRRYEAVFREIHAIKSACGSRILKVIIETCLLTEEEKIRLCEIVTKAGADFIKTSTGFGKSGATFEDVSLFAEHIGGGVRIKAAGGISSIEDAERFLELGASRLGTSRIVKIAKQADS